jgi:P4 family phage/plasmid primase-like protien
MVRMTPDEAAALDVARRLAAAGIPIFIAQPDASRKTGYREPPRWQQTTPDPAVVDLWRPGLALGAVMGHGLDLVDFDPRNGGNPSALEGWAPRAYAIAATPSGGMHAFIASLEVGSRDNVLPGIDVKGGLPDGSGRGYAFIAPTVRLSAVTGEPAAYQWVQAPDLAALAATGGQDTSGATLAARIRELRASHDTVRAAGGPEWWQQFMSQREPQSAPSADKAIAGKLAEVSGWTQDSGTGFRTVLLRAALTLGGYVGGGYLDEADARERLEKAVAEVWTTPDNDDLLWIQQGLDDGSVRPFYVFTAEQERTQSEMAQAIAREGDELPPAGGPPTEPPWTVFAALGVEPFDPAGDTTDQGLAKAVAMRMYPALRYATDAGLWVKREQHVWGECAEDMSAWIVSLLGELMPLGQSPVPKEASDRTEAHWQAVRRATFMSASGTGKVSSKLRAIIRSDHPASLKVAELDVNPEVLWAGGVPWDLKASGDVPIPAFWVDPNTPHLRTAMCAPDPTVATPRWDAFVAAVMPDREVRAWALRVLAIALTGYPDAALPILFGRERSGKTSLVEMLIEVLGSYAHAANPKLLNSGDGSHDTIIYDLRGRRLSFIDEGPKRGHDATERLKQLTGGGSLTGRPMRGNPVTFKPSHTLVMTTNPEPNLTDPALRARVRLIPCDTPEEIVRPLRLRLLGNGLAAEAPGILAAMMRETAAYLGDRDSAATAAAPVSIRGLAEEIAEGQDPISEWVETCTVPTEPGTQARILYSQQFARWHADHPRYRRLSLPSETAFGRKLTELGYEAHKLEGRMYRPLSVLNGGFGVQPTPPTPATFMGAPPAGPGEGSGGFGEGSGRVLEGFRANPPGVETPAQGVHSDRSLEGREGFSLEQNTEIKKVEVEENTAQTSAKPSTLQVPTRIEGLTSTDSSGGFGSANPPEPSSDLEGPDTLPGMPAPARRPDPATGRYTKAAAKAAEKEAARLAAAGESVPLPASVDRAGAITALTPAAAGQAVAEAVARAGALTVDVETSGYPLGHERFALRTTQLGDEHTAVVLDHTDPAQAEVIRAALATAPVLHAHSATADLVPLVHLGLLTEAAWGRMHDTVIPAKLADPQSTGSDPGLKQLADAVLGSSATAPEADKARALMFKLNGWLKDIKATTAHEKNGWAQVDPTSSTMIRYAASDVLDTAALAARLPQPPPAVAERERAVQRITARVAHRGVRVDHDQVRALEAEHTPAMETAAAKVRSFGIENPGSDRQLADTLTQLGVQLPRTQPSTRHPEGQASVAAGVLEGLRDVPGRAAELISTVLEYRHHETVLTTFLEPYRVLCESGDARARPTVYTLGTDTGRMSCVRPNLQQLPREGGVRACITADPGHVLISADFSGVEIRVMAALSQDPELIRQLREGVDLHAMVAERAFGPGWTKGDRYTAKRGVFGWAYGGGVPNLARQVGVPEETMQAIVDALQLVAPSYVQWADQVKQSVRRGATQMPTYAGRVIHLPREYPHKAANYCIQGTARELLVDALLEWDRTEWGGGVVLPVHDEIVAMVPEADAERATEALVACMSRELYGIPIKAEASEPSFAWRDSS